MKLKHEACKKCLCRGCVYNRPGRCADGCDNCKNPETEVTDNCNDKEK